jgi:hypothetical protein
MFQNHTAIKTDQEGHETSWSLTKKGESAPRYYGPDGGQNYLSSTSYSGAICVGVGMYEFTIKGTSLRTLTSKNCVSVASANLNMYTITDLFRDGMCCDSGRGYYDVDVQNEDGSWRSAVRGSKFFGMKNHIIGEH